MDKLATSRGVSYEFTKKFGARTSPERGITKSDASFVLSRGKVCEVVKTHWGMTPRVAGEAPDGQEWVVVVQIWPRKKIIKVVTAWRPGVDVK